MYARVTLLEIDTLRTEMAEALELFERSVLPELRAQPGFEGVYVLTTPEGRGMLVSFWASADAADAAGESGFYAETLARHMTLFRSPPGRERYEVAFAEVPARLGS